MQKTIFILEDEEDISLLLKHNFEKEGFVVKAFMEPESFLQTLKKESFSVLLLDLMLPQMSGLEVLKLMKNDPEKRNIPIIVLTAKNTEFDKILGLELGADDYVTKPFSVKEVIARVKAVLRRFDTPTQNDSIFFGDLHINLLSFSAFIKNERLDLTKTEFLILKELISHPNKVFSREALLESLWGNEKFVVDRTIDVHIKKLRDKLGVYGEYLKTIRGVGYTFSK